MAKRAHPSDLDVLPGLEVTEVETEPYLELSFGRLHPEKDYTRADYSVEFHAGCHWELREKGGRLIETDETEISRAMAQAQPGQKIIVGGLLFEIEAEGAEKSGPDSNPASLKPILADGNSDHGAATRAALFGRVLTGLSFAGDGGESAWSFDGSLALTSRPNPLAKSPGGSPAPAICIAIAEGDRDFRYGQDGDWTIY